MTPQIQTSAAAPEGANAQRINLVQTNSGWSVLVRLSATGLSCALLMAPLGCNATTAYINNRAGVYRYQWQNYACARDEFQRAIANNPRNPDYYHNLAAASVRAGDYTAGEDYYRQALSIDPSHQPSYHNLAALMQKTGRDAEAGRLLQAWADTQPDSDAANIELAWYRKGQGDFVGAEQALVQALHANPKSHTAASNLGEIYQEQGRAAEALALYERSLDRRWDQPQVQSRIASLKSSYPGTVPNEAYVANLLRSPQTQSVNLSSGGGTIESVAAFPLPRYQPNLWADRIQQGSAYSSGTTLVQSTSGAGIPSVMPTPISSPAANVSVNTLTARPISPVNADPAHVQGASALAPIGQPTERDTAFEVPDAERR